MEFVKKHYLKILVHLFMFLLYLNEVADLPTVKQCESFFKLNTWLAILITQFLKRLKLFDSALAIVK